MAADVELVLWPVKGKVATDIRKQATGPLHVRKDGSHTRMRDGSQQRLLEYVTDQNAGLEKETED